MSMCTYILGPCVDGTQAGKRCSREALADTDRCVIHDFRPGTTLGEVEVFDAYEYDPDGAYHSDRATDAYERYIGRS